MKRALPGYFAALCATLLAATAFSSGLRPSLSIERSTLIVDRVPNQAQLLQQANQLARVLKATPLNGWNTFTQDTQTDMTGMQLTVVDGLDATREAGIRFLFDTKNSDLISISMSRPNFKPGGSRLTASDCRAATSATMANVGEVLGGVWRWDSAAPIQGGVYHSRWRSQYRLAQTATDCQTGKLIYLRLSPIAEGPTHIAFNEFAGRATQVGVTFVSPSSSPGPGRAEKGAARVSLDFSTTGGR